MTKNDGEKSLDKFLRAPSTPGEILREEFMAPLGISQGRMARALGVPTNRVSQLLQGKRRMTADTALRLEAVMGMSAEFWLRCQAACDLWEANKKDPTAGLERLPELAETKEETP